MGAGLNESKRRGWSEHSGDLQCLLVGYMLYVLLLNPLLVFLVICRGDGTSRRMTVGSLTKIGLIPVVLVLAKGDHCCRESAGLGLSRTLLGKTVMGKGEQYYHEQAEVQKEEYPALALGDEEQRRKK